MYDINTAAYEPENFFAGSFPVVKDFGATAANATVNRHAPVVKADDGTIAEAAVDTLDKLIGIAADDSSGGEAVYYTTGEFFAEALYLPEGVTADALKPEFRKLGIFLKERD